MASTISIECGFCGKTFDKLAKHFRAARKKGTEIFFCSISCGKMKRRVLVKCNKCQKSFEILSSAMRSKSGFYYCSRSCSASVNNTIYKAKEGHPNWKDGSGSYRSVGLSGHCEDCGETRYYLLVVHHANKNRSQNGKDNLVTLCLNCHGMRHLVVSDGKLCIQWNTLTTDEAKKVLASGVQANLSFG